MLLVWLCALILSFGGAVAPRTLPMGWTRALAEKAIPSSIETADCGPNSVSRWTHSPRPSPDDPAAWEWLAPTVIAGVLFTCCFLASRKQAIWFDEVLSWTLINDPSLTHMMRALAHGADGMFPTYYIAGQLWRRVFGGSILSLRLLSSLGMIVGAYGLWAGLRRLFTFWASTLAVASLFCTSWMFLLQNSNLRGYGLLVGLSGIAFWLYSLASTRTAVSPGLFGGTVVCHAALVLTHPFGIVGSAVFLVGSVASDYKDRRVRWDAYAAIVTGWLALIPWIPAIIRLASINSSRNWLDAPHWQDLLDACTFQMFWLPMIVGVFVLIGFVITKGGSLASFDRKALLPFSLLLLAGTALSLSADYALYFGPILAIAAMVWLLLFSKPESNQRSRAVLYLAYIFLSMPVVLFVISRVWLPIFAFRYFLPYYFAVAIILAAIFDKVSAGNVRLRSRVGPQLACAMMFAAMLFSSVRAVVRAPVRDIPRGGISARTLNALAPGDQPIVIEDLIAFLPLTMEQAPLGHRYFYLLNAEALHHPGKHTVVINMLKVWFEYGYLRGQILPLDTFLAAHHEFLVLHSPEYAADSARLDAQISSPALYQIRLLAHVDDSTLLHVIYRPRDHALGKPTGTVGAWAASGSL